ncbi:MAG: hypothetical protein RMJ88_07500 [Thermogemmata sp.]|nr:hypothetical protein [Thermogemmata sp.]
MYRWLVAWGVSLSIACYTQANPITNGNITVNVSGTSGAIQSLTFGGTEYYNRGTVYSHYGFQVVGNSASFAMAFASGGIDVGLNITSVTSAGAGGPVTVTGAYQGISFTRVYSFVPGYDVLRITTTFTNPGNSPIAIHYFDTYDPDQGVDLVQGFSTYNDVLVLSGMNVAQSSANASGSPGYTVIWGGPSHTVGFLNGILGIFAATDLSNFLTNPLDPNGALADIGMGIVYTLSLSPGQSLTIRYDQAFGRTPQAAQNAFQGANQQGGPGNGGGGGPGQDVIPEPTSIALWSLLGLVGLGLRRSRWVS